MVDASETYDGGQAVSRGHGRGNLGLLSRFLGAVFLVLVSGLFLLDRALSDANQSQALSDAGSAALLTESFVASQVALLDRIYAAAESYEGLRDTGVAARLVRQLVVNSVGVRNVWAVDRNGRIRFLVSMSDERNSVSANLLRRIQSTVESSEPAIVVLPYEPRRAFVAFIRGLKKEDHPKGPIIGLVLDAEALANWLRRIAPETRLTIAVVSGVDTILYLDKSESKRQIVSASDRIVRLPTGGTWRIVTTPPVSSLFLRRALWVLGVLGISLLAHGLFREQRRALVAADRSVELERLYSDVKRANQAKSEFLANVSHELRTPLNAIVGFVELLRDGFYGDLSPRQVLPVDRIAASATHLRHLVDQVLDIAKIAAGRLEVHPELIVLRSFVLNTASELESLVSEKNLAFSITVGASLPRVRTDPTHLRQILINLIGNAVKYTDVGTISVRARLVGMPVVSNSLRKSVATSDESMVSRLLTYAPRSGAWIAVQVVDTGVGILKADLERIFDEFEQVNAGPRGNSMQRGTGLGLAISRRLARLLGGEITVESEPGKGSTFTVWLPVNPAEVKRETMNATNR